MKPRAALTPSWSTLLASLPAIPALPADATLPGDADPAATEHVRPFVHETAGSKALHFSISEVQSRMQLNDPHALDLEYTRTMMGFLLFKRAPRHITMIGLGGGSLAKFCYRHLPLARIQVVEINPHVIALREEFQVPADDHRFEVLQDDGALFVRRQTTQPDVLMVDGFDSDGLPPALCSQRFYDDCAGLLQPGGVLVVNLHYEHASAGEQLPRLRRSFDDRVLVVDDGERNNSIVFARKGPAFTPLRGAGARPPGELAPAAAAQLQAAFARISSALRRADVAAASCGRRG